MLYPFIGRFILYRKLYPVGVPADLQSAGKQIVVSLPHRVSADYKSAALLFLTS